MWVWEPVRTVEQARRYVAILRHRQDHYNVEDWSVMRAIGRPRHGKLFWIGTNHELTATARPAEVCYRVRVWPRRAGREPRIDQLGCRNLLTARAPLVVWRHMREIWPLLCRLLGRSPRGYRIARMDLSHGKVLSAQMGDLGGASLLPESDHLAHYWRVAVG